MITLGLSTIAQLLYPVEKALDFARIVAELETVLARLRGSAVHITWDCDDLVTFDMPETRILLAFADLSDPSLAACLTVSVGPGPDCDIVPDDAEHDLLCSRLVERIQNRFFPAAVIWRQVQGPIGAELVDSLMESLPDLGTILPPIDEIIEAVTQTDRSKANDTPPRKMLRFEPKAPAIVEARPEIPAIAELPATPSLLAFAMVANDLPDLPLQRDSELARLRLALYPPLDADAAEPVYSTQMRLAVHCMNATLIVVWAPLGAAVMTYAILRGEDMRLSGRLMAMTGTLLALAQSPIGHSMKAMAGV